MTYMSDFSGPKETNDNCRKADITGPMIEVFTVYAVIKINFVVCY